MGISARSTALRQGVDQSFAGAVGQTVHPPGAVAGIAEIGMTENGSHALQPAIPAPRDFLRHPRDDAGVGLVMALARMSAAKCAGSSVMPAAPARRCRRGDQASARGRGAAGQAVAFQHQHLGARLMRRQSRHQPAARRR